MDTNTTAQTTQWATELINKVDLLAAAIALAIIVHAIKPLFIGLRNFWKDYAIHSGGHWIGRQKTWLNQHSKFALAEWWGDATGNITSVIDRIYGFVEPKPESEKSEHESKQTSENATSDANGSFIDQMFSSWRQFLQRQAFTRALFIAYIYFYGFCLLLAFNVLLESTSWQLLILLAANLALLVGIAKWRIEKTEAFTLVFFVAFAFAFAVAVAVAVAGAGAGAGAIADVGADVGAVAIAVAIAIAIAIAGAIAVAVAVAVAGAIAVAGVGAGIIEVGTLKIDSELLALALMLAVLALYFLYYLRSSRRHPRLATIARTAFPWVLVLYALVLLYHFYLILELTTPIPQPASPLQLVGAQAETLAEDPHFYLIAFTLLFLIFPWINAALDWLSVSASRAAFYLLHRDLSAEQREDRAYGKAFAHLVVDLALALVFKLTVLLLLYIYAQLYGEFGVSFSVDTVKAYWALLNPLDSVAFSWQGLWSSNDHKFITLMVSTTLLPTLLHFGWVLLYVLCRSLWTLLRLLFAFAVSEAATFAATISVLITVAALTVLTMAIDPSDDDKNKENNTTNATQTSELLIPLPHL